jgi:hypothetical protein
MSLVTSTGGNYLNSSSPLNSNAPYTTMGWFYFISYSGGYDAIFQMRTPAGAIAADNLWLETGTHFLNLAANNGTFVDVFDNVALALNTWYHLALRRTSVTALEVYLDGVYRAVATNNITGRAATGSTRIGDFDGDFSNMRIDGLKSWTAALSAQEIAAERLSISPVRWSNLYRWVPCTRGAATIGADYSGSGLGYTAIGTITDAAPVPISWGGGDIVVPSFSSAITQFASPSMLLCTV